VRRISRSLKVKFYFLEKVFGFDVWGMKLTEYA